MPMINNFDLIEPELEFTRDPNSYYHLQIIQRKKDIKGLGSNNILIKAIIIDSEHPLSRFKEDIIGLCEFHKARAYINLAPKLKKDTAVIMLNRLAECFQKNDFNYIKRIWNTAAGQTSPVVKRWIIDCDWSDEFNQACLEHVIKIVNNSMPEGDNVIAKIPTLNGVHLITKSFDSRLLKSEYPDIDIHKNNPTVLYVPSSLIKTVK